MLTLGLAILGVVLVFLGVTVITIGGPGDQPYFGLGINGVLMLAGLVLLAAAGIRVLRGLTRKTSA